MTLGWQYCFSRKFYCLLQECISTVCHFVCLCVRLSVSVTRSVTRLHFFLVDTLGSASFFSLFLPSPFRLIARSPSPVSVFLPVSLCGSHHLLILCYLYLPFLLSVPSSLLCQRLRTLLRRRDRQMFTRLSAVTNRSLQCISKALELTG